MTVILHETAVSARAATAGTGPMIEVRCPPGLRVRADSDMTRAAFLNLLMNASQSGSQTPIEVECASEQGMCRIAIADRGAGIADDIRDRVFEPFFTTRASGTGLGLAIVRRLLESQDGTVVLRPRPGGGTIAEVTLPIVTGP
jgi:signal transduction histidine kinase